MRITDTNIQSINIKDMLEKTLLAETDIMIVQDSENTKHVTLRNFIESIIKDGEVPTQYRIYSALKVQNMLNEADSIVTEKVNTVLRKLTLMENDKVSEKDLDEIVENLENIINEKADSANMQEALDGKRSNEVKITYADLDTTNDANKLKIQNMSQEVLDYMTGAIAIPTNRPPIGGWRREDIADGAINTKKLSNSFNYVGNFIEGNINEMTTEGVYLLSKDIIGLPKMDENDNELRTLIVHRFGDEYITQEILYTNDLKDRPRYKRKCHLDRLHVTEFLELRDISNKFKVSRPMLDDVYSNCGLLESGSVFTLRKEGQYLVRPACTFLPTQGDEYLVEVKKYGDRYKFTATNITVNVCEVYEAMVYFTSGLMPVNTAWYKVGSTNRSKFDGNNVFLFGDGILFGIKTEDIPNKSIPGLLSNKYGMVINNRSTGDATIGHYEDNYLIERSVLTQIDNSVLEDAEYAIIFAGTNDWKVGKATIGKDTDFRDTTFKGSINMIIDKIMSKNNKTKLMFCTPIFRARVNVNDNRDSDSNTINDRYLHEYSKAMLEVCAANHVPCIDLMSTCMINKYNHTRYLADGLYPNAEGNALLAEKIISGMELYY